LQCFCFPEICDFLLCRSHLVPCLSYHHCRATFGTCCPPSHRSPPCNEVSVTVDEAIMRKRIRRKAVKDAGVTSNNPRRCDSVIICTWVQTFQTNTIPKSSG
jgi:hypothetical protein